MSSSNSKSADSKARILDAALALIRKCGGADVPMVDIAKAAKLSRQAVYLHFPDRADLMIALARHADTRRGLDDEIRKVFEAPTGIEAIREMVSMQARMNPGIWAIARAVDAVRRTDTAAEKAWQDRLKRRLEGCRQVVARLRAEGSLKPDLPEETAADLLWNLTSLRTWEDLVLDRKWTPEEYEERMFRLLKDALTI